MVYGTVANHGGAVAVETELGAGTTITLHLPLLVAARPAPEPSRLPAPAADKQASRLVLVVDDEEMLRRVNRRILERAGYRVMTASDGVEAVEVFRAHRADIGAIVLDMAMPGMGGAECYAALRAVDPSARVILASGFALEKEARDCLEAGALAFLEKPYSADRLLEAGRSRPPRPVTSRSLGACEPASERRGAALVPGGRGARSAAALAGGPAGDAARDGGEREGAAAEELVVEAAGGEAGAEAAGWRPSGS